MKSIAIIPARGGSKRIPRKNCKLFHGKPIIAYSIEAALESKLYDEVIVSTDDKEIAEIAIKYGAKVPFFRSYKNSNDFATTVDVLFEVLDWYKNKNISFEFATCIYACAPFVSSNLLAQSIYKLEATKCDCVFPILAYSHPIQRAFKIESSGIISVFDENLPNARTQDLEKAYHDAGMFYTFNVNQLYLTKSLRTKNTIGIEIDELQAHDIDSEEDWKIAEIKYQLFQK
jgi:N-acylneuraminate cytidylyltransferase